MEAAQVTGNHVAVTIAGAQGDLELDVFKPGDHPERAAILPNPRGFCGEFRV